MGPECCACGKRQQMFMFHFQKLQNSQKLVNIIQKPKTQETNIQNFNTQKAILNPSAPPIHTPLVPQPLPLQPTK